MRGTLSRYSVLVRNRPGEFARLTRFLLEEGAPVGGLRVASIGEKASVQFSLPPAARAAARNKCG